MMKGQIPKPDREDWDKMKNGLISRPCEKYNKSVMDFTKMDGSEAENYLQENHKSDVYERMNIEQFDICHEEAPVLIEGLRKKGVNESLLILVLVCLSLVSCKEEVIGEMTVKEKKEIVKTTGRGDDSVKTDTNTVPPPVKPFEGGSPGPEPYPIYSWESPVYSGDISKVNPFIEDTIEHFAEQMPEYPGGMDALFNFIKSNLKYPDFEKENEIQGTVYVQFVVSKEGNVVSPKILKSVAGSHNFDKEVLRIVRMFPKWIPGENGGEKVNIYFTIPFKFRLD